MSKSEESAHSDGEASLAFGADAAAVYAFAGAFFQALVAAGVAHVVVSPGSRSTPLAITAERTPGLRTWVDLDERAAAFFALGLAKATHRPAALVCTSGTAAANYLPAIVEAHYARVPLLVLTADRPPELRDWGAGQTIEQPGLYGRYPRWTSEVPIPTRGQDAERYAGQLAARAVEWASGRPAGAVHLNWPLREPLAPPIETPPAVPVAGSRPPLEFSHGRIVARENDVEELVALVRAKPRGLVCVGPIDAEADLETAILRFAQLSGWPVLADPASQLRSVEDGTGAGIDAAAPVLELGDVLCRAPGFTASHRPEVVLRLGETPVSKAQRLWIEASDPEAVWWLDEGGHWGEPSHRATRVVRGGAASLLDGASARLAGHAGRQNSWCRTLERANAAARESIGASAAAGGSWSGLSLAATLARSMPAESVLFSSNSMSIRLLDLAFAKRPEAPRLLCSRGASGIDGINSTALGVAAGSGRPTALLTGDLAFLHDLSGLLLARREAIPLTIVVLDDNGGGIFSFLPVARQAEAVSFERLFHTPHDVDLARAAALFELDYHAVDSVASLESALARSLGRPRVSVVHARVDAHENTAAFRAAVARACEAVDAVATRADPAAREREPA